MSQRSELVEQDFQIGLNLCQMKYLITNLFMERLAIILNPLDLQCAIGLEQLKRLDWFEQRRRENFEELYNHFKKYDNYFILPKNDDPKKKINWFGFILTLKDTSKFNRYDICNFYEDHKISTRTFFGGNILLHPAYSEITEFSQAITSYILMQLKSPQILSYWVFTLVLVLNMWNG